MNLGCGVILSSLARIFKLIPLFSYPLGIVSNAFFHSFTINFLVSVWFSNMFQKHSFNKRDKQLSKKANNQFFSSWNLLGTLVLLLPCLFAWTFISNNSNKCCICFPSFLLLLSFTFFIQVPIVFYDRNPFPFFLLLLKDQFFVPWLFWTIATPRRFVRVE